MRTDKTRVTMRIGLVAFLLWLLIWLWCVVSFLYVIAHFIIKWW
jgi:hypothetical protein